MTIPSPSWLAVDDEAVYVRRDDGVVSNIDPDTNDVTTLAEIPGDLCQGIGVGFGAVWTCSDTDVVATDLATGAVGDPIAGGAGPDGAIAATDQSLWVRRADTFLQEIDVTDGAVGEITADVTSGGDVIVAFGSLWATAYDDSGVTYRLALD